MQKFPTGAVIAVAIAVIVAIILAVNLQSPSHDGAASAPSVAQPPLVGQSEPAPSAPAANQNPADPAAFPENPIGKTSRNQMSIAAVWLPPIQMDHDSGAHHAMPLPEDPDVIHLEADVHAERGNLNGFGFGEWIPYLDVEYEIVFNDPSGQPCLSGKMMPMVAKDGPHYGATIRMPRHGAYRLTYRFQPPSVNGFGRHTDPVTGVAPWWEPFSVEFDFTFNGAPSKKS